MIVEVEKLDHHGKGITHIDDKIVFIKNALPEERVDIKITKDTSKYMEAEVVDYISKSEMRTKSKCGFYPKCGGCALRHMCYDNTLNYKKNKVTEILSKYARVLPAITVVKSAKRDFYRNKIEIKIRDGIVGFYENSTHSVVELDRCLNAEDAINSFLLNIDLLHIKNGDVTIKANYNDEIIVVIETEENPEIEIDSLREKNKLVGIVLNDKTIFGVDHFIEIIEGMFFKESYNSFFQINRNINSELFKIIDENIEPDSNVLDLCCGVGTLGIVASKKAKKVYGIEIVQNAIKDALINAKMNKCDNINFILGDAYSSIEKIDDRIDEIIIDPPRSGLNETALKSILHILPKRIIYVSCDPVTLSRDLKVLLHNYDIKKFYILDMFPYTYHCESVVILEKT